ncbi:MAG: TetR family transcriptional regulator C-terminal domain-containing protein [Bacteroidales bacterium]|nr:TetR family transcriptional regulator C-terminal domain-containing protein [Bacteroidales bacterium]
MYRVGNSKRSVKNADTFVDSLLKCLQVKDIDDITITELCNHSGLSRNTFYRIFDVVADVLVYASDRLSEKYIKMYDNVENGKWGPFIDSYLHYLVENSVLLEAIYKCNRQDILENSMLRLKSMKFPEMSETPRLEYINGVTCAASISILVTWIRRGKKETPSELYKIFREAFANKFKD